ncbi:MAG: hypothetical protein LUD72_09390, partial [Bacteroidales bacterium]|nr:hypothetical protein [Bacteroidales bacterium]
ISPYLIYDNGASLKNKGVEFTRRELVKHLVRYYNQYGNDGYILLMDYSKYYDNIHHDILLDLFRKYIHDDTAIWLLETIVEGFKVDVSYMSDEEYASCMDVLFNSLDYERIDREKLTGEKFMRKHLDIGNQTSQSAGILYPTAIDNYFKIRCGEKFYARYMDDSYCISNDKEHLRELFHDAVILCRENGIALNEEKSRIVRLSDRWRFLQIQYSLTDTGRIMRKVNPRQVTVMRRKMKTLAPRMTEKEFHDWVFSWLKCHRRYLSNRQYGNIIRLYYELKGETKWSS